MRGTLTKTNIKSMIRRRRAPLLVVALFSLLGVALLVGSNAATPTVAVEAESGVVAGKVGPGQIAGASGGASVGFGMGAGSPAPAPRPLPVSDRVKLYTYPGSLRVPRHQTFVLEIRTNTGTTPVNAVKAHLQYRDTRLAVVKIDTAGSAFDTEVLSTNASGLVSVERRSDQPVTGNALVVKVTFTTKGSVAILDLDFANSSALIDANTNTDIVRSVFGAMLGTNLTITR